MRMRIGMDGGISNAKAFLAHPLADEVSIAMGTGTYSNFPHSVELAFFKNGDWQYTILDEFAPYHTDGVYAYVPLHVFADFLKGWKA